MTQNFGSKRNVVGAHYGLRDWLAQRITALLMALFTLLVLAQLMLPGELGYDRWAGIFAAQWMKVLTFVVKLVVLALIWAYLHHAVAGLRHIWMDATHSVSKQQGHATALATLAISIVLTLALGAKLFGLF